MRKITVMLALVATAGISLGASAAASAAQPEPAGTVGASITLTKAYDYGAFRGMTFSATLTCNPDGGTHPNAAQACAELARVAGDFDNDNLGPNDGADRCKGPYNEYLPVRVTAEGIWDGKRVSYQHSFPNSCWLSAGTGSIFKF